MKKLLAVLLAAMMVLGCVSLAAAEADPDLVAAAKAEGTLTVFGYNSDGSSLLLETTFTVDNIDKVAPDAPTASSDAAVGAEGVLVTATFSDDSVTKQFSSSSLKAAMR